MSLGWRQIVPHGNFFKLRHSASSTNKPGQFLSSENERHWCKMQEQTGEGKECVEGKWIGW